MSSYHLKILNYQSLKNVEIDIEGITVLYGMESNVGKTAFVRALDGLLFGGSLKDSVTWGEKRHLVELSWDSHSIKWIKGDGVNDYMVDGIHYSKVGKEVPEAVQELGFKELVLSDLFMKPQIRKQFDKAWPMTLKPSDMGKVAGSLVETEKVYVAMKELLSDGTRIRSRRSSCETEMLVKTQDALKLSFVDNVKMALENLPMGEFESLSLKVGSGEVKLSSFKEVTKRINELDILNSLQIPELESLEKAQKSVMMLEELKDVSKRSKAIPEIGMDIENLLKGVRVAGQIVACIDMIEQVPEIDLDTENLLKKAKLSHEFMLELKKLDSVEEAQKKIEFEEQEVQNEMSSLGLTLCEVCGGKGYVS